MAELVEYTVAREHQGDRLTDDGSEVHLFQVDEKRLADPTIVATLVDIGVLVPPKGKAGAAKAEDAPADNKSEPAPKNKAEPKPATKGASGVQPKGE